MRLARADPMGAMAPPGQIMATATQITLKPTPEQRKELAGLQKTVDAGLQKVLSEDQKEQLKQIRADFARGNFGGARTVMVGPPGGPGGPPPGGPGGLVVLHRAAVPEVPRRGPWRSTGRPTWRRRHRLRFCLPARRAALRFSGPIDTARIMPVWRGRN